MGCRVYGDFTCAHAEGAFALRVVEFCVAWGVVALGVCRGLAEWNRCGRAGVEWFTARLLAL